MPLLREYRRGRRRANGKLTRLSLLAGSRLGGGAMLGSEFAGDAVRGALGSALTQGIGVATGLQGKFDWAGVAAAGIGGAAGGAFGREVLGIDPSALGNSAADHARQFAMSSADAIAQAATRGALQGTSFGDNLAASIPSVIGNTLGRIAGGAIARALNDDPRTVRATTLGERAEDSVAADLVMGPNLITDPLPGLRIDVIGNLDLDTGAYSLAGIGGNSPASGSDAIRRAALVEAGLIEDDSASSQSSSSTGYQLLHATGYAQDRATLGERTRHLASFFGEHPDHPDRALALEALRENWRRLDRLDAILETRFAQDLSDFGRLYVRTGSMINAPLAAVQAGIDVSNGNYLAALTNVGGLARLAAAKGSVALAGNFSVGGVTGRFAGAYATNGDLVQSIATRADNWGIRRGLHPVDGRTGTLQHGYAEELLGRYQRIFGDRGLRPERRYINGGVWESGMGSSSSIRLDVVEGPLATPTHVWDYKFGNAILSPGRVQQIRNGIPNGANVPIDMVKP